MNYFRFKFNTSIQFTEMEEFKSAIEKTIIANI